jgi:hypothetical protein
LGGLKVDETIIIYVIFQVSEDINGIEIVENMIM